MTPKAHAAKLRAVRKTFWLVKRHESRLEGMLKAKRADATKLLALISQFENTPPGG